MRKLKIYLDTSFISHLYQLDAPDKMKDSIALWDDIMAGEYEAITSEIAIRELMKAPESKRAVILKYLENAIFPILPITAEVEELAQEIIQRGILTARSFNDCVHIASAILDDCNIIVSWNFNDLVNFRTIQGIREITISRFYKPIDIYSPPSFRRR